MDSRFAVIADAANIGERGKLNILGIFEELQTDTFPVRLETMALVLRFECNAAEFGQTKQVEVVLQNADGREVMRIGGLMAIPTPTAPWLSVQQIINLEGIAFDAPGDYAFYVLIGGETKATVPLKVIKVSK